MMIYVIIYEDVDELDVDIGNYEEYDEYPTEVINESESVTHVK